MKQTIRATKLMFLIFGIGISSWAPMVPFAKNRLSLNDAELGVILLVFGIGAIATMPISGWLVSRLGSRSLTQLSGFFMLGLIPFLTVAHTYFLLGLTLFLFGAATSAMNIAINVQALTVETQAKKALMSGFHCFFSVGGLLGVSLVGILLELGVDLFYCGLFVSLLMAITIAGQHRKLLEDVQPVQQKETTFIFSESGVLILGLLCFIAFMAEGAMLDWSAEFLCSSCDYPISQGGMGYAVFSIAMALGRLIGDRSISRYGAHAVFRGGGLLAAIGFFTLICSPWKYVGLAGFFLVGLGASNIVPILFSSSKNFPKTPSHFALTIITSFGYSGLLIGPGLIGLIANSFSLPLALSGIACLLTVSGAFGPMSLPLPEPLPVHENPSDR